MRIRYECFLSQTDARKGQIHVLASNFWTVYASVDDGNTLYTVRLYMSAYVKPFREEGGRPGYLSAPSVQPWGIFESV